MLKPFKWLLHRGVLENDLRHLDGLIIKRLYNAHWSPNGRAQRVSSDCKSKAILNNLYRLKRHIVAVDLQQHEDL